VLAVRCPVLLNSACAGMTPVKMQAKMAPATVSGIRVLGFTVSSCDAFDERAGIHWNAWDFISPRVALCFVLRYKREFQAETGN